MCARSCIYIAEHQLNRGTDIDELVNARELAESVAKSNSEHADHATELEKKMENERGSFRESMKEEIVIELGNIDTQTLLVDDDVHRHYLKQRTLPNSLSHRQMTSLTISGLALTHIFAQRSGYLAYDLTIALGHNLPLPVAQYVVQSKQSILTLAINHRA